MEKKEAMRILKDFHDKSALFSIRTALDTIIPELKESEDERIRKHIISVLEDCWQTCKNIDYDSSRIQKDIAWLEKQSKEDMNEALQLEYEKGKADALQEQRKEWTAEDLLNRNQIADILQEYNRNDLIDWLEKQGEKNKLIQELGEYKVKYIQETLEKASTMNNKDNERIKKTISDILLIDSDEIREILDANNVLMQDIDTWLEKQDGQKPVPDWMLKFLDELRAKKNYFDWDEHKDIEGYILAIINWMKPNYFNRKNDEHKPAWSKEDESWLEEMELMCLNFSNDTDYREKFSTWLKHLKDKVQLQSQPAEWSDYDEKEVAVLEAYIRSKDWSERHIERALGIVDELVNKVKSLRPQKQWKPSAELMNNLSRAANGASYHTDLLLQLYIQLKQL